MSHKPPKGPPTVNPVPLEYEEFVASKHAGTITERALHGPPGLVRSPRSGKLVSPSTAQAEYNADFDSIPVRSEAQRGGLWDWDADNAQGPRKSLQRREPRKDSEVLAAYFAYRGNRVAVAMWEIYQWFWQKGESYKQIAERIGKTREHAYDLIKRLRREAHSWWQNRPDARPPQGNF